MKELTIEQKAQRYDEAIERAKRAHNSAKLDKENGVTDNITEYTIQLTETIFHELKKSEDSEDDKMRNFISNELACLRETDEKGTVRYNELTKAIDWLEKQGEHANFRNKIQVGDKVTRNEDGVLVNLSQLNRVAKKQGEQKPTNKVEPKFNVGDKIISTISNIPYYVTEVRNGYYLTDVGCIIMFDAQDNFELSNQNPALSEEDEIGLADAMLAIEKARTIAKDENDMGNLWCAERWLKSLKERYTWKPSEKQINAIRLARSFVTDDFGNNPTLSEVLKELEEQLKKLK